MNNFEPKGRQRADQPPMPKSDHRSSVRLEHTLPSLFNLLCLLLALSSSALGGEVTLRLLGFPVAGERVQPIAELEVSSSFIGNQNGLFVANTSFDDWPAEVSINSDGFRSPEFGDGPPKPGSVMLIGDSFTWGAAATPITNSFADLLREQGLAIHNFGIPGTGPTQYQALAEKYLPMLGPDVVIVFLYLGNDLKSAPDPMVPARPLFHVTNAGWIWAWDDHGNYLDPRQAYEKYVTSSSVRGAIRSVAYSTATGSLMWQVLRRAFDGAQPWFTNRHGGPIKQEFGYTFDVLRRIRALADQHEAEFVLAPIPNRGFACGTRFADRFRVAAEHAKFQVLELGLDDDALFHSFPDCHLTNEGHRRVFQAVIDRLGARQNGS